MNMSSSSQTISQISPLSNSFLYRDVAALDTVTEPIEQTDVLASDTLARVTASEVTQLLNTARSEAVAETERRLKGEFDVSAAQQAGKVAAALESFAEERKSYFSRVESDVVHLALAIATKILHREAQVDPMLIAALVRVAVNKLHDGSSVTVRVATAEVEQWKKFLAKPLNGSTVLVLEDANLATGECLLETELGSANFSIDAQLKEVEQGFFDLLAQRPLIK